MIWLSWDEKCIFLLWIGSLLYCHRNSATLHCQEFWLKILFAASWCCIEGNGIAALGLDASCNPSPDMIPATRAFKLDFACSCHWPVKRDALWCCARYRLNASKVQVKSQKCATLLISRHLPTWQFSVGGELGGRWTPCRKVALPPLMTAEAREWKVHYMALSFLRTPGHRASCMLCPCLTDKNLQYLKAHTHYR